MFDIIGKRNWFFAFSLALTIPGLIFILLGPLTGGKAGLQFSIDYTGGTKWEIRFVDRTVTPTQVKEVLVAAGFADSVVQTTSDDYILIFERTKEELRVGKSLPAAIEAGFNRAWNSILDSNVSSLITATILFLFGSSTIKGFGLVLIVGVLVSMFTAITVTRTVLRIVVAKPWARKAALYGVTEAEFLARPAIGRGSLRGEARGRV